MRLNARWTKHLTTLPETGMGYQIIDVHLENGTIIENLIVVEGKEITGQAIVKHGQIVSKPTILNFSINDITDITLGSFHS